MSALAKFTELFGYTSMNIQNSYEWAYPTFLSDCGFIWVKKINIFGDIPVNLVLLGQMCARNKYAITCNCMYYNFVDSNRSLVNVMKTY